MVATRVAAAAGALQTVLKQTAATSIKEDISLALQYANEGGCDLVQSTCFVKKIFYSAGFSAQVNKVGKANSKAMNDRISEAIQFHELEQVAEDLIGDLVSCDNAVLVWSVQKRQVEYVMAVPPDRVEYANANGRQTLKITLAPDVIADVQNYVTGKIKLKAGQKMPYPQKYIDAVKTGTPVQLSNDDGEYWAVKSNTRKFSGLARPRMKSIFLDVLLRELLISGDWSVAMFIQNVIQHIKAGETIQTGPRAGESNYDLAKAIKLLKKQFEGPAKSRRVYTDHTVLIELLFPDPKVFDPSKFKKVEERIIRWGGVVDAMMTGEGDGFAQGYLGKARFEAEGRKVRKAVDWMFCQFFLCEDVQSALGLSGDVTVVTTWDEQSLKDWKEVQAAIKLMLDYGGIDWGTAHQLLGVNHDLIKQRMQDEKKEAEIWKPLFEPRQGLLSGETPTGASAPGTPGRPATKTTPTIEPPKPSNQGV